MGADLNNIVKTQKLSDEHVQFLVYQILRGMKYVHSAGIIHRVSFIISYSFTLAPSYIYTESSIDIYISYTNVFIGFKAFKYCCERGL